MAHAFLLKKSSFFNSDQFMKPCRFTFPSPSFSHYWEKGRGRELIEKLDAIPSLEAMEKRIPLYFEFDEQADEVVRETFLKLSFSEAMLLFQHCFQGKNEKLNDFPSAKQLVEDMKVIPNWLDTNLLNDGMRFCQRSGAYGLMVLRNYALMGGYESAAINKPLVYTGALKKGASKRLLETTEFWIQVVAPGAFESGQLQQYALQTRLIHSFSRLQILDKTDWDNNKWGVPLNKWDMVATNLGFSIVFLNGLRALGFQPTEREVLGLFHFWKYLGFLIGIPPELLPQTEKEAIHELYLWTMNQPAADTDTIALARALKEEPLSAIFPKYKFQKLIVKHVHLGYNAFFLGKESCDNMHLPYSRFRYLQYFVRWRQRKTERNITNSPQRYEKLVAKNRAVQEEIVQLFYKIKASEKKH